MSGIPRDIEKLLRSDAARINPAFKNKLRQELFQEKPMSKKVDSFRRIFAAYRLLPASAALAAVMVVGGASAVVTNDRAQQAREQEIALPADLSGVLSIDAITQQALSDMPNSKVVGVELEQEDGVLYYKVKFDDGSFRLYNAITGAPRVSVNELERDEAVPAGFVAGISLDRAREIALSQRPNKTIQKIELDVENGVVVYSVRFTDDGRVDVNAADGSIVRVRNGDSSDSSSDDSSSDDSSSDSSNDDDSSDDSSGRSGSDSRDDSDDDSNDDSSGRRGGDSNDDSDDDDDSDNSGSGSSN